MKKYIKNPLAIAMSAAITATAMMPLTANALPNGRPFQELSAAIAANSTAITGLQENVSAINIEITAIYGVLDGLDARVTTNEVGLQDALVRITTNEGDIDALQSDIGLLRGQLEDEISRLNSELVTIRGDIDNLVVRNETLAADLATAVLNLTAAIDANSADIGLLERNVSLLSAAVATNNSRINFLTNRTDFILARVNANSADIASLESELSALKDTVATYHDPCVESIAVGQSLTGTLTLGGECTSDSRSTGFPARYYTFDVAVTSSVIIAMNGVGSAYYGCGAEGTLRDPYLYLHSGGRDGAVIANDDDAGCYLNSRITRTLNPGTYTIEATEYSTYSGSGTFTLTVN